jgi:hypothetical protein
MTPISPDKEHPAIPDDVRQTVDRMLDEALANNDDVSTEQMMVRAILAERNRDRWQDINTAPKDGSIILICGEAKNGFFVADAKFSGWWMIFSPEDDDYTVELDEPTHWQPLPSPPQPTKTGD